MKILMSVLVLFLLFGCTTNPSSLNEGLSIYGAWVHTDYYSGNALDGSEDYVMQQILILDSLGNFQLDEGCISKGFYDFIGGSLLRFSCYSQDCGIYGETNAIVDYGEYKYSLKSNTLILVHVTGYYGIGDSTEYVRY